MPYFLFFMLQGIVFAAVAQLDPTGAPQGIWWSVLISVVAAPFMGYLHHLSNSHRR